MLSRRSMIVTTFTAGVASLAHASPAMVIHPLATGGPGGSLSDLSFIRELVGDKAVVGLGEATHGSKEIFHLKSRMVETLVGAAFRTVAFELGFADGLALDRYVTLASNDAPVTVLKGIGTFSIANGEVLALVQRLRAINGGLAPNRRVHVFGYDVQTPGREAALVVNWLSGLKGGSSISPGPSLAALAASPNKPIQAMDSRSAPQVRADVGTLLAAIDAQRAALARASSDETLALMRRAVGVIDQAFGLFSAASLADVYDLRDKAGADNIAWQQARTGRRTIAWAHNGHIDKGSFEFAGKKLLGGYLDATYGRRYYAIATAFYEGDVRATHAKDGVVVNHLPPARAGSLDAFLVQQGGRPTSSTSLRFGPYPSGPPSSTRPACCAASAPVTSLKTMRGPIGRRAWRNSSTRSPSFPT